MDKAHEYDKDELVPPKWLNKEFFEQFLLPKQKGAKGFSHIKNVTIEPATKKGEHYASVMFRVKVTIIPTTVTSNVLQGQRSESFIVKALPELESDKQRLLQDSKLFENEIEMYTEVLPQLEKELRLAGVDERFSAKCLYTALTPVKVLVFEDLAQLDYQIVSGRSLTLGEIKAAYRNLAQWHATSYKLSKEQPSIYDKHCHNIMAIPHFRNSSFITSGITNFIHMLDSIPSLRVYKPYFVRLQPNWANKCRATYMEYFLNSQSKMYYGICHGDFYGNNLMFRNADKTGELTDLLVVDYQLAYMGPLVNDLISAFFMIYTAEQRLNDHVELLKYYFYYFVETLEKMGCQTETLTFESLQLQMKHQRILGKSTELTSLHDYHIEHILFDVALFLMTSFLPLLYAKRAGLLDKDYVMATDEQRRPLYFNADYIDEMHHLLPIYQNLGYLE